MKKSDYQLFTTKENVNGLVSGGGVPLTTEEAKVLVREGNGISSPDVSASYAKDLFVNVLGFVECLCIDDMSSAGNWGFLLREGDAWFIMTQHNNWPDAGFEYRVDVEHEFETPEDAEHFYCNA